jgi:O-antigen/teichoic acid export membrane protein
MSKRKEILKDAGIYTVSSYLAQFLDVAAGILIRRLLGPANMGIWAFLQVIQNYAKHSGLGVTTATARDIPYYLAKGEPEKANEVQNLVFTFSIAATFLTSAAIAGWACVKGRTYSKPIFIGLFVMAALIILQRLYNLFIVVIRSHKQFIFAGWLNIISSALTLVLSVSLAWKYGLYGYYAAAVLTSAILLFIIFTSTPHRFHFDFRIKPLIPLLSLGLAVVAGDLLRSVLTSIDRIMITKYLGFEALGHYSIALMAGNYLYSLPNMINVIFFPHLQEAFAKRDSLQDTERFLRVSTLCVACLFPYFLGLVWLSADWLIPILLPKYIQGIPSLKYFVLGSFFMAVTHPFISFLITAKKHWALIPTQAAAVALGFTLIGTALHLQMGIEGVAAAAAGTYFFFFLLVAIFSLREIPGIRSVSLIMSITAPFVYATVLLLTLDRFLTIPGAAGFFISFTLFAVLMIPFVLVADREAKLIATAGSILRDLFQKKTAAS